MHYNTFDAINVNIRDFKSKLENENIKAIVLNPSESIKI